KPRAPTRTARPPAAPAARPGARAGRGFPARGERAAPAAAASRARARADRSGHRRTSCARVIGASPPAGHGAAGMGRGAWAKAGPVARGCPLRAVPKAGGSLRRLEPAGGVRTIRWRGALRMELLMPRPGPIRIAGIIAVLGAAVGAA